MSLNRILLISFVCGLVGCASQSYRAGDEGTKQALPSGATNVKDVGNNWITFQWNNAGQEKCFLYHKEVEGINEYRVGFESITLIPCK